MENLIKYQVGRMTKDPREMSETERMEWKNKCSQNARDYLFSIGQPMVYRDKKGKMVAEYQDGKILLVE